MTAIGAARPGPRGVRIGAAVAGTAMVVGLAVGVLLGSVAARTATAPRTDAGGAAAGAVVAPATAGTTALGAYKALTADIARAERTESRRMRATLGSELRRMLTAETIGAVYLEKQRLESSLAVASANGDHHAMQMIHRQLDRLCGTETVRAYLDFCN
jgi:hypothetical protein